MALTQAQDALLTEAITNLNRSTEVNKEVLEIVKSVGNTGAVDIATHNTDPDSHPAFNRVLANSNVYVGSPTFEESTPSSINLARVLTGTSSEFGNGVIDIYNRINTESQSGYGALRFNCREIGSGKNFIHGSISARSFVSGGTATTHSLNFQQDDRGYFILLGIKEGSNPQAANSQQIYLRETALSCTRQADLGTSSYQWKDCYLMNSPIVSSDERLKQDIADVPEAVFRAWGRVGFKQYRFKEAVEKKGADARLHVGLIAQEILEAFEAEGLDATVYGIVCHDSWEDQYVTETITDAEAVLDEKGNVVTPEKTHQEKRFVKAAGDLWTVRYEEALALETAYQRWRLSKIEAALAAKGITL